VKLKLNSDQKRPEPNYPLAEADPSGNASVKDWPLTEDEVSVNERPIVNVLARMSNRPHGNFSILGQDCK